MIESLFASLPVSIGIFAFAGLVILAAGTSMSTTADRLADRTGWGEAIVGTVFLAGATSLPDFAASITAAADGRAELAVSNMVGSLSVNMAFLAVGDLAYRKANLEHAAASSANLVQAALLIALMTIALLAMLGPDVALWRIHPATFLLLAAYPFGLHLVMHSQTQPMWRPRHTAQTVTDRPNKNKARRYTLAGLWVRFGLLALALAGAGWALMRAAAAITAHTGLSETMVGTLFTAVSTSSPELVTTIAAIRAGALTLAVGNILGTNAFNVTAIAAADIAYREGSIYHAITSSQIFWGLLLILMTAILLLGFVRREKYGIANIGFESFLILVLYAGAVALLFVAN